MSRVWDEAGGPSCVLIPQIGHKLGLCVCVCSVSSGGTTQLELTSNNGAHAGYSVSHYCVQMYGVMLHLKMMKPSNYLLFKKQQKPDMPCSEISLPH